VLPLAVSIDVTWRCNLCCRHCYFVRQGLRGELGEDEWARILSSLPVANAVWVGGEPLLRADLIERLRRLFPVNWVVTNGTLPIPNWRDVVFFVSVDGTEPYHDRVRGRGTYRRVRDVIESHDNRHTYLGTVISSLNRSCVGELVNEWSSSSVRGVNFDFYTPSSYSDPLWLGWNERDEVIAQLRKLREEYGDFVLLSDRMLDLMTSHNAPLVTSRCPLPHLVVSLDPLGRRKLPCVMTGALCERCGCAVPYFVWATVVERDPETVRLARRLAPVTPSTIIRLGKLMLRRRLVIRWAAL